jgi:hypothetical protein
LFRRKNWHSKKGANHAKAMPNNKVPMSLVILIIMLMKLDDEMYLVDETSKFWECVVKLLW